MASLPKSIKVALLVLAAAVALPLVCLLFLVSAVYVYPLLPHRVPCGAVDTSRYEVQEYGRSRVCGSSELRRNGYGWWELETGGTPEEIGAESGALMKDLIARQEDVFVSKIEEYIPSRTYRSFLCRLVLFFNRNMDRHIPEEFLTEIYALSRFAPEKYGIYGPAYERQINYHAAHDIGHMMQGYMLVGCTSFAARNGASMDSSLVCGRNFDFYFGDGFAENRLVTLCRPDSGYAFVHVGWPGMSGVVSGMNSEGLTVTINASSGPLPMKSAMPVTLLTRRMLQYASTVSEAVSFAEDADIFVSESILVCSARERRAVIIEKNPERTCVYDPDSISCAGSGRDAVSLRLLKSGFVACSNHFQSAGFADDSYNAENIRMSDSPYRLSRVYELADSIGPVGYTEAVRILRDRRGLHGKDIGLFNQKAINQSIAHHSVVFKPEEKLMWLSTSPWQGGSYVCYDLSDAFSEHPGGGLRIRKDMEVAPDSVYVNETVPLIGEYRQLAAEVEAAVAGKGEVSWQQVQRLMDINPCYFGAYALAAEYMAASGEPASAVRYMRKALQMEIPSEGERAALEEKLARYEKLAGRFLSL